MTQATDIWGKAGFLINCEALRNTRRKGNGRLTFDCHKALCGWDDGKDWHYDRVQCRAGHKLAINQQGNTLRLVAVLKGVTSLYCRSCKDFDGDV